MFNDKITKSIAEAAMKVMAASQGTTPKNEKERKLAALAAPKDKITHKDVMVGRGVIAKEEVELEEGIEDRLEAARAKAKAAGKTINPPKKAAASTVRKVAGKAYGGAAQVDKPDEEDEEGEKPAKRGRGRPKGSTGRSFKSKLYKESFSELIDDLNNGGVKSLYENVVFEEIIEEEPDNEQFTKEVEQQKKKAAGTAGEEEKAKVAKASVQAVKNEGVEVEMFDADGVNGVQIEERELTPDETKKKEEVVKSMKKKMAGFKERYGDRAREVMYATATKMAKKD